MHIMNKINLCRTYIKFSYLLANITATSTGRNHVPAIIDSTLNACRLYNGANKPLLTESQAASKTEIES